MVQDEVGYLSNDCFWCGEGGSRRKMVKQKLYSFKKFLCSFVFFVGLFKHLICYLLFDSVSDLEIIAGLLFLKVKEKNRGKQEVIIAIRTAGCEQMLENK